MGGIPEQDRSDRQRLLQQQLCAAIRRSGVAILAARQVLRIGGPCCALVLVTVGACTHEAPASRAALAARAWSLVPSDERIAGLYVQSCRSCHVQPASGAPLTGDTAAWRPRLERGIDVLVASAVTGKNGMPAGGQCFRCTTADYAALIRFMAAGDER